jgi:hypothetical protein
MKKKEKERKERQKERAKETLVFDKPVPDEVTGRPIPQHLDHVVDEIMAEDERKKTNEGAIDSFEYIKRRGEWKTTDDDIFFLDECYENMLTAIQQRQQKVFSNEVWGPESTFDDWLGEAKRMLFARLGELEVKYRQKLIRQKGLTKFLEKGQMINAHPIAGTAMSIEDYEAYQEIIHKGLEAIEAYQAGLIKLTQPSKEEVEKIKHKYKIHDGKVFSSSPVAILGGGLVDASGNPFVSDKKGGA